MGILDIFSKKNKDTIVIKIEEKSTYRHIGKIYG